MRPKAIVAFESIIFVTIGLGLIQFWLDWHRFARTASTGLALTVLIFTIGLVGGLTILVSRRRSKIAMWISIAMFALGLPMFLSLAANGLLGGSAWISAIQTIGQFVAYGMLFTPSARSWLRRAPAAGISGTQ